MDIEMIKMITRVTMMFGSGKIVGTIIKNQVPTTSPLGWVVVRGTGFVIGGMLTDATGKYTDRKIDEINDVIQGKKKVTF